VAQRIIQHPQLAGEIIGVQIGPGGGWFWQQFGVVDTRSRPEQQWHRPGLAIKDNGIGDSQRWFDFAQVTDLVRINRLQKLLLLEGLHQSVMRGDDRVLIADFGSQMQEDLVVRTDIVDDYRDPGQSSKAIEQGLIGVPTPSQHKNRFLRSGWSDQDCGCGNCPSQQPTAIDHETASARAEPGNGAAGRGISIPRVKPPSRVSACPVM